jgi:hypothetical protein
MGPAKSGHLVGLLGYKISVGRPVVSKGVKDLKDPLPHQGYGSFLLSAGVATA